MRLLLDTHIFLLWNNKLAELPSRYKHAIENPENMVYVSAVTAWEIAIKRNLRKLEFAGHIVSVIQAHDFLELPISASDAESAGELPLIHRDPFDRLLVAQTRAHECVLLSTDPMILEYDVPTL